MRWEKKGKIFDPTDKFSWMKQYAQNPNALELEDRLRIYFTTRPDRASDGSIVSYTSFIDVDKNDLSKILYVHEKPVLSLGEIGEFDEFGIMPGSLVKYGENGEVWMYYVGWTRMVSVPYNWSIGLAISYDHGKTFKKYSKGPIIGNSYNDPYLQACPRVYRLKDNNWIMYYNSGIGWNHVNDHIESVYITRVAISDNGINWNREDGQIFPSIVENECQTSPTIIEENGIYHMFFSYRHGTDFRNSQRGYRIGYACSNDLFKWERNDNTAGIDVSEKGWDSEMICYPHVFKLRGKILMLYCGNYFGKEGFGLAELMS